MANEPATPATSAPAFPATPSSPNSPSAAPSPTSSPPDDGAVLQATIADDADDDFQGGDVFGDMAGLRGAGDPEGEFANEPAAPAAPVTPAAPQAPAAPSPTPSSAAPATPVATPASVSQPQAPAQPLAPAPVTPAPALATPSAQPAQTPAAAPAAPAQPAPAATPQPQVDPVKAYQEWRANAIETLATTDFALSAETAEALELEPAKVYPRLAANLYMTALENCMAAVREMIPGLIEQHTTHRAAVKEATDKFFTAWPALREHEAKVAPIGSMFRALNPTATVEQYISHVGEIAHATLGIPKPNGAAAPAAPTPQPLRPHTPIVAAPAPRAPNAQPQQQNPFDVLAGRRDQTDYSQGTIPDDED